MTIKLSVHFKENYVMLCSLLMKNCLMKQYHMKGNAVLNIRMAVLWSYLAGDHHRHADIQCNSMTLSVILFLYSTYNSSINMRLIFVVTFQIQPDQIESTLTL